MRVPLLSLALLPLLLAAVPARAQDAGSRPFPGIAWGADADSVIRVLGEPVQRKPIPRELEELDYVEGDEAAPVMRYILVHPTMGTVIAGYVALFENTERCQNAAEIALKEIGRAFPRLVWEAGAAPAADAVCDPWGGTNAVGQDPESGTRVSLRLDPEDARLTVDAISPEAYEWLGGRG